MDVTKLAKRADTHAVPLTSILAPLAVGAAAQSDKGSSDQMNEIEQRLNAVQ